MPSLLRTAELRDAKLFTTLAAARPTRPAPSVSHSWMKIRASLDEVVQFCAHAFAVEFGGICCLFRQHSHRQVDSGRFLRHQRELAPVQVPVKHVVLNEYDCSANQHSRSH